LESPLEIKIPLGRLLKEIREYGLTSLRAEAACLHIFPEQLDDAYNRINDALISNQNSVVKDGLEAIAHIILNSYNSDNSSEEPSPISMLSQYIKWCPTYSIRAALWIIIRILRKCPTKFFPIQEMSVLKHLDRLLIETGYDSVNQDLNFDEKLEFRRISSILAATLWYFYNSKG
jgi:hypothetical protein